MLLENKSTMAEPIQQQIERIVRSAGYLGAVQSFTDPQFARMLVTKLKEETGGKVPRFYQVLFQVRYRDGVPTETKLVLGREMH